MLHWLHRQLVGNAFTRKHQRRLLRNVKHKLHVPDAYGDLVTMMRKVRPVAFLDIGAHVGSASLSILDELPNQAIHAFEPTPESFAKMSQQLAGRPSVRLHPLAVGDVNGPRTFHLNREEQTNSLLENDAKGAESLGNLAEHVKAIEVQVVRLDDWVPQHIPGGGKLFIKADIQGAEGMMIAGGREVFRTRVSALHSEVLFSRQYEGQLDFRNMYDLMVDELGFVLFDIYPCSRDAQGRAGWADVTWVKAQDVLPL